MQIMYTRDLSHLNDADLEEVYVLSNKCGVAFF